MKAIILAGGIGHRLRETVKRVPKPMAPVGDKPFLEYLVLQLAKWKIKEIIFSIGYKRDIIKTYFGNGEKWGVQIKYSEEDIPLGTGGGLREAALFMDDDCFIVMNGDSFFEVDISRSINLHKEKNAIATLGLLRVDDTSRFGSVGIDKNGEILSFSEKGRGGSGLINGGVYIFNREIIENIPPGKVSLENDILPSLVKKGLYGVVAKGFFVDIGTPEDYLNLCKNPGELNSAIVGSSQAESS
ncbi:nucleotidyltransferase family protein [Thermodesulfobacteriota bacterium]